MRSAAEFSGIPRRPAGALYAWIESDAHWDKIHIYILYFIVRTVYTYHKRKWYYSQTNWTFLNGNNKYRRSHREWYCIVEFTIFFLGASASLGDSVITMKSKTRSLRCCWLPFCARIRCGALHIHLVNLSVLCCSGDESFHRAAYQPRTLQPGAS